MSMTIIPILGLWEAYNDRVSNSRESGIGIVIFTYTEGLIEQQLCITFYETNNVSKYKALLMDLRQLMILGAKRILVHIES